MADFSLPAYYDSTRSSVYSSTSGDTRFTPRSSQSVAVVSTMSFERQPSPQPSPQRPQSRSPGFCSGFCGPWQAPAPSPPPQPRATRVPHTVSGIDCHRGHRGRDVDYDESLYEGDRRSAHGSPPPGSSGKAADKQGAGRPRSGGKAKARSSPEAQRPASSSGTSLDSGRLGASGGWRNSQDSWRADSSGGGRTSQDSEKPNRSKRGKTKHRHTKARRDQAS